MPELKIIGGGKGYTMIKKFKWVGFGIGVIVLAILTFIEMCIRKLNSIVEGVVYKFDHRSLEEQTQSFMDSMYKYSKENLIKENGKRNNYE